MKNPDFSIIIIAETKKSCENCIKSIKANTNVDYELLVFTPEYGDILFIKKLYSNIYFINSSEFGSYSEILNRAVLMARGDFVCVLHDDTLVSPGWLGGLFEAFDSKDRASCIGPITNRSRTRQTVKYNDYEYNNNTIRMLYIHHFQNCLNESSKHKAHLAMIDGFCFFTHSELLDAIGDFENLPPDLCIREWIIRAGALGLYPFICDWVFVYHEMKSRNAVSIRDFRKISELNGPVLYSFFENELNLKLR